MSQFAFLLRLLSTARNRAAEARRIGLRRGHRIVASPRRRRWLLRRRGRRQRPALLLGEKRLERVPGDKGSVRAMFGVFGENRAGDPGIVPRREKYEPPVVPQVAVGLPLRGPPALERDHLCRSRLAGDV